MGVVFGMPYLMDNSKSILHTMRTAADRSTTVDPELKAEFEERQKGGGVGATAGVNSLQNFDAAAWLAGTSPKDVKKSEPQGKITR